MKETDGVRGDISGDSHLSNFTQAHHTVSLLGIGIFGKYVQYYIYVIGLLMLTKLLHRPIFEMSIYSSERRTV